MMPAGRSNQLCLGLSPQPYGREPSQRERLDILGTLDLRQALGAAHGYDVDAVLAASAEFRRVVIPPSPAWMSRGEALHIVRALVATQPEGED